MPTRSLRHYHRSIVCPPSDSARDERALERALDLVAELAGRIGGRRPTSPAERKAREAAVALLGEWGVEASIEGFNGYSSFAWPFGVVQAAALAPSLLPARHRRARSLLAAVSALTLAAEGDLRVTPLSNLLSRRESGNVVATIEPRGEPRRTLVLMSHLDSSRSGLIFHPRLVGLLGRWIALQALAGLAQGVLEPLIGGRRWGRRLLSLIRAPLAAGLCLLAERELRGVDVPGANDNASGCGVAAALAAELASDRLAATRVILLMTGCEEAGTLGASAFLDRHDTEGSLFLNFDNVGADRRVRFLRREGVLSKWPADPDLVRIAQSVADARPELRLAPEDDPAGLTYDSSPVLARGGRAMTLSAQDGYIPNLHWPTDTVENLDRGGVARTLAVGREIIAAVDRGALESAAWPGGVDVQAP
jgi:hypothetical protein